MLSKLDRSKGGEEDDNSVVEELPGIPLAPPSQTSKDGVYFILEKASLTAAYVGKVSSFLSPLSISYEIFGEENEICIFYVSTAPF